MKFKGPDMEVLIDQYREFAFYSKCLGKLEGLRG